MMISRVLKRIIVHFQVSKHCFEIIRMTCCPNSLVRTTRVSQNSRYKVSFRGEVLLKLFPDLSLQSEFVAAFFLLVRFVSLEEPLKENLRVDGSKWQNLHNDKFNALTVPRD